MIYNPIKIHLFHFHWSVAWPAAWLVAWPIAWPVAWMVAWVVAWTVAWVVAWTVTIPEVQRYRSYEEPDETPNWGAQFGSWFSCIMWYFVTQQRGCKWVFVWTLQWSINFQTPRRRDLHQQAQTNGVVKRSSMGARAHETPNQGTQFGKCWHWPALLPLQMASLYSAIANSK